MSAVGAGASAPKDEAAAAAPAAPEWERNAVVRDVEPRWARTRAPRFVVAYSSVVVIAVVLWVIGYPRGWLALYLVGMLVHFVVHALNAGGRSGRWVSDWLLGVSLVNLVATGGMRSPILVGAFSMVIWYVIREGRSRGASVRLALYVGACALMTVAPPGFVAPPIPEPLFSVWAFLSFAIACSTVSDLCVFVAGELEAASNEMAHARDELATQALLRARDLELIASKLSHELRNPLSAIKALVELASRSASEPRTRARLEVAGSEINRMHGIVEEYLSFSRPLQASRPEELDMAALADRVLSVLEARAKAAEVRLERRGAARVVGDPKRLTEALMNLVANAIEASPAGKAVLLEIEEEPACVRIRVRDEGHGMSPEVLARLGTPFFTTRSRGTGLGVVLARGVFVEHGGELGYESQRGRGTTATGTLPRRGS